MNRRLVLFMLVLLAPDPVFADTSVAPTQAVTQVCRQAIAAAERAHGIPSHLLAAIARVESGRRDQASGTFNPWPWTINFDGQGSFYDSKAQAVTAAVWMRPRAAMSVDVGCMQISLTKHPDAFATMDQAFDPMSNADYGARFLLQLYEKTVSWPKAVGMYHSATADLGHDYQEKVYAAWPEEQKLATAAQQPIAATWGLPFGRPMFSTMFRQNPMHVIPPTASVGGAPIMGRTLDAYRAQPVRLALRTR